MFLHETGSVAAGFIEVFEETTAFKYDSTYCRNIDQQRLAFHFPALGSSLTVFTQLPLVTSCTFLTRSEAHCLHPVTNDHAGVKIEGQFQVYKTKVLDENVTKLHIPHSVQSSPSLLKDKQFSQDVNVESPLRPTRTRSTSCPRGFDKNVTKLRIPRCKELTDCDEFFAA